MLKKMKAGDLLQPVVIREGVLVAMVEEIKEMPKPGLETVKEEIRNYLVMQKNRCRSSIVTKN
ncbi:peptidylprolyl isomerase [Undibacterium arcticum]